MGHKILIVDDEADICEILSFKMENDGYEITVANSAEEALTLLNPSFSLIILDVMMGGMSGYKMAEKLRKEGNSIPIIFLTAKDAENDMLTGFAVGADDYVPKPFSLNEVSARVKAVLKRTSAGETSGSDKVIEAGGVKIDNAQKEAWIDNQPIQLTKTEFGILSLLIANQTKLYSRSEMIDLIWSDTPFITERTVDVHINRLRKKMGDKGRFITSKTGYGYKFSCD
jgi:DNA-binding response OmpR family regulator